MCPRSKSVPLTKDGLSSVVVRCIRETRSLGHPKSIYMYTHTPGKPSSPERWVTVPQSNPLLKQSSPKLWATGFPGTWRYEHECEISQSLPVAFPKPPPPTSSATIAPRPRGRRGPTACADGSHSHQLAGGAMEELLQSCSSGM